jgi:hypothetical protein
LNSIWAQNIEKKHYYEQIEKQVKSINLENVNEKLELIQQNIKLLKAGLKVQESSARIMNFIVQDLLDYAHIKSDYDFHKNIS